MPTAKTNGIELYYEIEGEGPPLVMIMGLACSARQWCWMVPVLKAHFTVITFDNRGAGRSGKPGMDYSTGMFADDVQALMQSLGLERAHVFGVSVGGMIAQAFALRHPDCIDRLVLGCTMPNFFHLPPSEKNLETMQSSYLLPLEQSVEAMMNLFLTERFMAEKPAETSRLKEIMMLEKPEQGEDAFFRQMGAAMSHDTLPVLQEIAAPTLVISGDADPMVPVANARLLAERIPGGRLVELPGGYHAFWVERPGRACKAITEFLLSGRMPGGGP